MLMVIFGAGASHDSVPDVPARRGERAGYRPPLSHELFANYSEYGPALDLYPQCRPIIPNLRYLSGKSVEQLLEQYQEQSRDNERRRIQLAAVRFYLRWTIWDTTRRWVAAYRGITNYASLLGRIYDWRRESGEDVVFVTFNYDTMLEQAATDALGINLPDVDSYIATPHYSFLKLHGSIHWGRVVEMDWTAGNEAHLIDFVDRLTFTNRYVFVGEERSFRAGDKTVFPAIAIPVERKAEFVCPESHVRRLQDAIPQTNRLLVVGWRGLERHFLDLWRGKASGHLLIEVVTGSEEGAKVTAGLLAEAGIVGQTQTFGGGFTGYLRTARLDHLLKAKVP